MTQQTYPTSPDAEANVPVIWQPGDVILDLYEVTGILGEGGMGTVYKVHHKNWNVDLAVKSPKLGLFTKERGQANFIREAETWVNLGLHPHTVSCYYVRTLGGIPRVFAEYVEGGSLADWIRTRRVYEGGPEQVLERILDTAIQFAWGLDYAHEQGLVHQDVKPANVMMTADGTVKVTDFGLAKARVIAGEVATSDEGHSILVSRGGMTPAYCSPEQAAGQPLSRKTDIWSWAVSLLEMFVGEVTWSAGQVAAEALADYLEMGPKDTIIPPIPSTLTDLLQLCFQIEPEVRPKDMQKVANIVQEIYVLEIGQPYPRQVPKSAELLPDSLNNQAVSFLDLGKAKQAEWLWNEASRDAPYHPEITYNRGTFLWRQGRITPEALVEQIDMVRRTYSEDWLMEYLLGLAQLEQGEVEAAVMLLEEAAQLATGQLEVQAALQMAHSEISNNRSLYVFREHGSAVSSVSLSVDGRLALSGSLDKTMRLWETTTSQCLYTFNELENGVHLVSLSGNGHLALSENYDGVLRLWEVATGQCLRSFLGHTEDVHSINLSTDGRLALSGGKDQYLRLWDTTTGQSLLSLYGHTNCVESVSLSADGQLALSGSRDGTIRLWDVISGQCVRVFHDRSPQAVHLSSDGHLALSGGSDKTLRLWKTATGQCLRTFQGHTGKVTSVSLSADGQLALSGSLDNTVRLWKTTTGQCLRIFQGHTGGITSVSLSIDRQLALSGSWDETLCLWKIPDKNSAIFAPRLSRPRSFNELSDIQAQWNELLRQGTEALEERRYMEALSKIKRARELPGYEYASQGVELWRKLALIYSRANLQAAWLAKTFEQHSNDVTSVSLSADGRLALSGGFDNKVKLWEVATGRCFRTFDQTIYSVLCVCLNREGTLALSGGLENTLRLWEVATGKCLHIFKGHEKSVCAVSLGADERFVLSGSYDKTLRLWELATGKCLRIFKGHWSEVTSASLSEDGQLALSGSQDKTLRLWQVDTGKCLCIFEGHEKPVSSVCLSINGWLALSGSWDETLRLWETSTGKCLQIFRGHTGAVSSVYMSEDGRLALSGSEDGTLRLWEMTTGRCLWIFRGHTHSIKSVCLSGDACLALSGSKNGTLKLWQLDWELSVHDPADWDDEILPYLQTFLTQHTPRHRSLFRRPTPKWTEEEFQKLVQRLQYAGYGWLRPGGIRQKLERLRRDWRGPPTLK